MFEFFSLLFLTEEMVPNCFVSPIQHTAMKMYKIKLNQVIQFMLFDDRNGAMLNLCLLVYIDQYLC